MNGVPVSRRRGPARRAAVGLLALAAIVGLGFLVAGLLTGGSPAEEETGASLRDEADPPVLHGRAPVEAPADSPGAPAPGAGPAPQPRSVPGGAPAPAAGPAATPAKPWRLAEPTADPATGTLRLRVTDGSGHPREGVHARGLSRPGGGEAKEAFDADLGAGGEGEFPSLPPGRLYVGLALGHLLRSVLLDIAAGRVTEAEIALPPGATMEGQVRHAEKGPLAGVTVTVGERPRGKDDPWSDRLTVTTGDDGRYRITEVPAGTWPVSLQGQAIGYHPRARATVTVSGAGTVTQDFVLGGVSLRGVVRDAADGKPLAGVEITLQDPFYVTSTTDADGAYAFFDIPSGDYPLSVDGNGYGHVFGRTGPLVGGETRTLDFALDRAAVLDMVLADPEGRPVTGEFFLGISPVEDKALTSLATNLRADAEGRATYPKILPGVYDLSAEVEGGQRTTVRTEVRPGRNEVRFVLARSRPEGPVELRGTVKDRGTGSAIPGVSVTLQQPLSRDTTTDAQGEFAFGGLPTGPCVLVVSKDGYGIRFLRDVQVKAGEERTMEVLLDPAATLFVDLVDARGAPVVGHVTLAMRPLEGGSGTSVGTGIEADALGHAVYRQIVPGRYRLRFVQEGAGSASVETEVVPGENRVFARLE